MKKVKVLKLKPIKISFDFDSDRDGVKDKKDCQPFNPKKQEVGSPSEVEPKTYKGYKQEDYYWTPEGYKLSEFAKPVKKKGFFSRLFGDD